MILKQNFPTPRPFLVAISGSIGSGKSTVGHIFKYYQPFISCDKVNQELIQTNLECKKQIITAFGEQILKKNQRGDVDTQRLKKLIFENNNDNNNRKKLESIMHPMIIKKIIAWIEDNLDQLYLVVEVPLLVETGWHQLFDKIIIVETNRMKQIERVKTRDNLKEKFVEKIKKQQVESSQRQRYADFIIKNNSNLSYLKKEVKKINTLLLQAFKEVD